HAHNNHSLISFPTRRSSDLINYEYNEYGFTSQLRMNNTGENAFSVAEGASPCWVNLSGKRTVLRRNPEDYFNRTAIIHCPVLFIDRKSTRLNSSHVSISYAV